MITAENLDFWEHNQIQNQTQALPQIRAFKKETTPLEIFYPLDFLRKNPYTEAL